MNDSTNRLARLRYIATGALAALAAAGAIAGTAALAANQHAKAPGHAAAASGSATKTPAPPARGGAHAAGNPFVIAVQRLVDGGTISSAQAQALDREILAGRIDTQTLAASGFTQTQLQAVQQTLSNTKRALAGHQ